MSNFIGLVLLNLPLWHFSKIIHFNLCENVSRHSIRLLLLIANGAALVMYEKDNRYSILNLPVLYIYDFYDDAVRSSV
jgi:hypothetical protein